MKVNLLAIRPERMKPTARLISRLNARSIKSGVISSDACSCMTTKPVVTTDVTNKITENRINWRERRMRNPPNNVALR